VALRKTLERLRNHPLVKRLKFERQYGNGAFKITFTDGIREYWYQTDNIRVGHHFSYVIDRPLIADQPLPTYREFETNPLEDNYEELLPYFLVTSKEIQRTGFCDLRLKVHELINELVSEGWKGFHYPESALRRDLEAVRTAKDKPYWESPFRMTMYSAQTLSPPGKLLMSHFNPVGTIRYKDRATFEEAWQPLPLFHAINYNIDLKRNLTRATIIRALSGMQAGRRMAGPRLPNAMIWRVIFETLKPESVLDIDPNFGEKAIAAAVTNTKYAAADHEELRTFIKTESAIPNVTILNTTNPISDNVLKDRISAAKTTTAIAVVTREQAEWLPIIKKYELRTEPVILGNILHILAYFKIKKEALYGS
jgi:hypothetical protein